MERTDSEQLDAYARFRAVRPPPDPEAAIRDLARVMLEVGHQAAGFPLPRFEYSFMPTVGSEVGRRYEWLLHAAKFGWFAHEIYAGNGHRWVNADSIGQAGGQGTYPPPQAVQAGG